MTNLAARAGPVASGDLEPDRTGDGSAGLAGGLDVTFVPSDPPRAGRFALFDHRLDGHDLPDKVDLVVAAGASGRAVRRRTLPARLLTVTEVLPLLLDLEPTAARQSARCWATALAAGLGLLARGRLLPAVSPAGFDAWRAGPLDPADLRLAAEIAAAFPPEAHAVAIEGSSPLRVRSPEALLRAAWDCLADTLPRTPAAGIVAGSPLFADPAPQPAESLRTWVRDAGKGIGGGAAVALRIELGDDEEAGDAGEARGAAGSAGNELDRGQPASSGEAPAARAVLQLTSRADPSLVVDAAHLFGAPAAVLARFGDDAETDLLLALRRGARAWPPLEPLLRERAPSQLPLDEDRLAELIEDGSSVLQGTGIEVLWPSELVTDGLEVRAVVSSSLDADVDAGFGLATLLEFRWQATLEGAALTEEELDQLAEAKRGLVRLRGRFVAADPGLLERLRARAARRLSAAEALAALLAGGIEIDGELVPLVAEGPVASLAARLGDLGGASRRELAAPPGLTADLRPYQERGVAWLHQMCDLGLGGVLADDMGLGKTIQVIALHLHRRAAGAGPTLVVCPTSLLGNWERELHRFAPEVPVRRYHLSGRHLRDIAPDEVVVTTYGIARLDRGELAEAGFSLVVADEAQHAKNPLSETARALRAIGADVRIALSGTPVENRLTELWSILDWTTPGLLGPLERFRRTVAVPIERYRDPEASARLGRVVKPFLLRRRKTDPGIAPDLPSRTVTDRPVPLTAEQASLYEAEVREALAVIANKDGIERRALVLRLLTVLKQICNHPAQYLHQPGPIPGRSGKLAALEELLEVILSEGDSVLVFSQYVELCALLEARLSALGIPTLFLSGKVPVRRREEMVRAFQAGEAPVFLLSLKAGGVGLNLTRATHVVHYDRWWNPAVEDQATDRAHRIGQDRPVQVHRLICEGTVEDRIATLLERKRSLAESVIGGGEAWLTELSDADLAELVSLGGDR